MAETGDTMEFLGQPGEPCEECGSPLAADQRYCLNCGRRRGGPRVDYRQQMPGAAAEPPPPAGPAVAVKEEPAAEVKGERDYAPLAAVGGIAVLGLMLLVGVLIGKGDSSPAPAPAPVVRVGAAPEAATGGSAEAEGAKQTDAATSGAGGKNAKGAARESTDTGDAVQASQSELEELENESGEEAQEKALKLPDKIATPGKPPPIDKSKPPGGGEGGGLVIK